MLSTVVLLIALCLATNAVSQKSGQKDFELGVSAGFSWYNGDLNPYRHLHRAYMHNAYGLSLRKNLNQRFALRWQLNKAALSASDELSTDPFRYNRNLNFYSDIYEFESTIEFNYLEFDALIDRHRFSPYTYIGISVFRFNPKTYLEGTYYDLRPFATEGKNYSLVSVAIPFGFGMKMAFTDRLIASIDWGLRRTFTDYLDDVSTKYPKPGELSDVAAGFSDRSLVQSGPDGTNWNTQRGDPKTKDWYSTLMLTVSVRLGPKKGSCKHIRI